MRKLPYLLGKFFFGLLFFPSLVTAEEMKEGELCNRVLPRLGPLGWASERVVKSLASVGSLVIDETDQMGLFEPSDSTYHPKWTTQLLPGTYRSLVASDRIVGKTSEHPGWSIPVDSRSQFSILPKQNEVHILSLYDASEQGGQLVLTKLSATDGKILLQRAILPKESTYIIVSDPKDPTNVFVATESNRIFNLDLGNPEAAPKQILEIDIEQRGRILDVDYRSNHLVFSTLPSLKSPNGSIVHVNLGQYDREISLYPNPFEGEIEVTQANIKVYRSRTTSRTDRTGTPAPLNIQILSEVGPVIQVSAVDGFEVHYGLVDLSVPGVVQRSVLTFPVSATQSSEGKYMFVGGNSLFVFDLIFRKVIGYFNAASKFPNIHLSPEFISEDGKYAIVSTNDDFSPFGLFLIFEQKEKEYELVAYVAPTLDFAEQSSIFPDRRTLLNLRELKGVLPGTAFIGSDGKAIFSASAFGGTPRFEFHTSLPWLLKRGLSGVIPELRLDLQSRVVADRPEFHLRLIEALKAKNFHFVAELSADLTRETSIEKYRALLEEASEIPAPKRRLFLPLLSMNADGVQQHEDYKFFEDSSETEEKNKVRSYRLVVQKVSMPELFELIRLLSEVDPEISIR